jgi:hypothetical protein
VLGSVIVIAKFMIAVLRFEISGTQKVLKIVTQAMNIHLHIKRVVIIFDWKFQ